MNQLVRTCGTEGRARPAGAGRAAPVFCTPPGLPTFALGSQIVEVGHGRTIYIAGQVALDEHNRLVGGGDLGRQTEQVFRNLQTAMRSRGGDLGDIVRLTIYVLNLFELQTIADIQEAYLGAGPRAPACTLLQVSHLFRSDFKIAMDAVAWLPRGRSKVGSMPTEVRSL